jgi:HCOMODA/2-hydroxy-3-carboxy-muconic semialdehyde decarboxylase
VNAAGRKVYLERFIHGEIYRKRPDVMAIVHSHSHSVVPLSVVLISSNQLGAALADCLGNHDIVLMRGHGSTVVGGSVQQAVYRAVYAELNARYQLQATQLGEVTYLTEGESQACIQTVEGQVQRPWDLWVEHARARRG